MAEDLKLRLPHTEATTKETLVRYTPPGMPTLISVFRTDAWYQMHLDAAMFAGQCCH
jgi:hypothetical protein